jgi:hypothetical protein
MEKYRRLEILIELIKAFYPLTCFALSGAIAIAATIHSNTLSNERWVALVGLSAGAITAGAGIAQSPQASHSLSYKRDENDQGEKHEEIKTP